MGSGRLIRVVSVLVFICAAKTFVSAGSPFAIAGTARSGETSKAAGHAPNCRNTQEKERITITCDYARTTVSASQAVPPIAVNHAFFSFGTKEDNYMEVEFAFTNLTGSGISDKRDVYLEIDDAAGGNYIRRPLPVVDFRKLVPGQPLKFSARLLVGAFMANHYYIYLWIPSSDPSLKFKPANNFLLSSFGVADPVTGLNKIAEFTVERRAPPGRNSK